jgi:hypothetical protein
VASSLHKEELDFSHLPLRIGRPRKKSCAGRPPVQVGNSLRKEELDSPSNEELLPPTERSV